MTLRANRQLDAPGQDSFLDVVFNLVGILIIFVMIIGTRATDAMVNAVPAATDKPAIDVETPQAAAAALETDLQAVAQKIHREDLEIEYRRKERDKMNVVIAAAERAIEERRQKLDDDQRRQYDVQRELVQANQQLEALRESRRAVEHAAQEPGVIEHLPTPLAKTVFGKQLHFRLLDGRLAYVPWDELVDRLKAEAPQKIWKLKEAPRITETIGPLLGFRMKYTLRRTERTMKTEIGVAVQTAVELERFVLLPAMEDLGEPVEAALRPGSAFRQFIEMLDPNHATITVWVYPNSMNEFRAVKQAMFALGFAAAARPLPDGFPIGGSPSGSRSAAE